MDRCPVCHQEFAPDNPASRTVMLGDEGGRAVWLPVCRACAQELEESELATHQQ